MNNNSLTDLTSFGLPVYVALAFSILTATLGQILFKLALHGQALSLRVVISPIMILGFFSYGLSSILWLMVLAKMPLGIAYPFISINFVLIALAGSLFFHERFIWQQGIGMLLLVVGLILIVRS